MKLASFALSRRDPNYVPRALDTQALETARQAGSLPAQVQEVLEKLGQGSLAPAAFQIGSVIFANKPGDGSAREQAASCQRVLGAAPTSAMSLPPSGTAPTASTGACSLHPGRGRRVHLPARGLYLCPRCKGQGAGGG